MKKGFVMMVAAVATSLVVSVSHAGGHMHKHKHKHKRGGATVSYSIDATDCSVTINSTKDIKKIVLKDSKGKVVKRWGKIRDESFSDFGMYTSLLTDGSLHVLSGKHRKRRGSKFEIGDQFREELADCLDASVVQCPAVITVEIDRILETLGRVEDEPNYCEIYGTPGNVQVHNGLTARSGFVQGVITLLDGSTTIYDLSLEEADACQLYHGQCNNYDNRL